MTIPTWLDVPVLCLLIIIVMGFLCLLWRSLIVLNKSVIKLWAEIGSLWVAVRKLTELFESLETDCPIRPDHHLAYRLSSFFGHTV